MMLQINTDLNRRDVIISAMIMYITNKTQMFLVAAFSVYFTWSQIPQNVDILKSHAIVVATLLTIKFFLSVIILVSFLLVITTFLNPKMKKGLLGGHQFSFTEDDFTEATDYNESKHQYSSVTKILTIFHYLIIQIAGSQYHTIPFRCFENETQREQLISVLRGKLNKLQQCTNDHR